MAITLPVLLVVASVLYVLVGIPIYRLYFDPLSKFPGPKLAAVTSLYAAYYDLIKGGQYVKAVEEMHKKYGPVVRIRPDSIHVNDPNFIDVLYVANPKQRRHRYKTITRPMMAPGSVLATDDHDLHRKRRISLASYFSKSNVRRLEPHMNETVAALMLRMKGWAASGKPVAMNTAYRAAAKDIIQAYAFGEGDKYLDREDCYAEFFDIIIPQRWCYVATYFPSFAKFCKSLPKSLMIKINPRIPTFAGWVASIARQITAIKQEEKSAAASETTGGFNRTIFHEIIRNPNLPDAEKETQRLVEEALVLVMAGSETTASTMAAVTWELLSKPHLLARLRKELETVMPELDSPPDAAKLDNLPFLNALLQETLRCYPGATNRQDRVAPDEPLTFTAMTNGQTYTIPQNTAVGMTAPIFNKNPLIYDRPDEFDPDRYLNDPKLKTWAFSFSKGARQCVGMWLAYQEMQAFIAGVFRHYGAYDPAKGPNGQDGPTLEIYKSDRGDVAMHADYVTPGVVEGSLGLRVIVRE